MNCLFLPLAVALSLAPLPIATVAHAQPRPKTIELFNGHDLAGWEIVTRPAAPAQATPSWHYTPSGVLTFTGKPVSYLATKASHQNYRLHVEWRWPAEAAKNSSSGILLHLAAGPINPTAGPICFQMQLKPTRVGDVLPMAAATFAEALTSTPGTKTPQLDRRAVDSEKPLGEWNACDILCIDDTLEVRVNGVLQNKLTKLSPASGRIGIQLEGTPYEVRNVRLSSLAPAIGSSLQTAPTRESGSKL